MDNTEHVNPLKDPLQFLLNNGEYNEEELHLVQSIKKTAENTLYHWKTFPIHLPLSFSFSSPDEFSVGQKKLDIRDLFILPNFDELDAVALDVKGEQRKLSKKQLWNIRDNGEFEVDSVSFFGQSHRWKLSQLLQKGTTSSYDTFLKDLSIALWFLVVTAKNRIHSEFFSLSISFSKLAQGLLRVLDMLIGIPSLKNNDLQAKLREERSKYLVAELVTLPDLEDDLDNLCLFVKQQIRKQSMEKYDIENERIPKVPYRYASPKGVEIDLRLFDRNVIKRALPAIATIIEREARGWFPKYREKIVLELKSRKLSDEDIERLANLSIMDEFMDRISDAILHDEIISELGDDIGMLLIKHAWSIILMHRAVENVHTKLFTAQHKALGDLKRDYPILSLIGPWVKNRLKKKKEKFISLHRWSAHEEALLLCRAKQLNQANYFLHRDLTFMREREPVLMKELSRVTTPTRIFHWRTQTWLPKTWKVTRVFQGQTESIPTVITQNPTSITNPRADPNQPVFLVEKQHTRTTSSRWPFWRWINYCHRTWTWTWNAMFLFAVLIPWCSPVSFRSLFFRNAFMPDLELSQVNGTLFPRKSSTTQTLCSRLILLWRHISKSRTEFESQPDTGFIGKGFTRHMNRIWNYIIKGAFGTLGIVLIFPLLCLLISTSSLCFAIIAPFWMPVVTLLFHLATFAYDFDSPDESRSKIVVLLYALTWLIVIQGVLQPIFVIILAFIFCPLLTFLISLVAICRYTLRTMWDGFMYHSIIKRKGRIPAGDSFIVKRIAGPGLSTNFYYQVKPEQALAAFEAKLEIDELDVYKEETKRQVYEPLKLYSDFVSRIFNPFSASLNKSGTYKKLEKECDNVFVVLNNKVEKRKRDLQLNISVSVRSKIKLPMYELKLVVGYGAKMLEKFYPVHVLQRLQIPESAFWDDRGLIHRDWIGLSGIIFSELFSPEFLTPLEDADKQFRLEIKNLDVSRFANMLVTGDFIDDLGDVNIISTPKGNIHIAPPYIDLTTFNPRGRMGASVHKVADEKSKKPWKKTQRKYNGGEKLMIPLPLPHPCHIAIIIYNRENDEPIIMESEACQNVLKAIEESTTVATSISNDYINIDNGSVGTQSLESASFNGGAGISLNPESSMDSPSNLNLSKEFSRSASHDTENSIGLNIHLNEDLSLQIERDPPDKQDGTDV